MMHVLLDVGIVLVLWVGLAVVLKWRDHRAVVAVTDVTGYASLGLILLTLAIGPWRLLRGKPNPLSSDLTRDVGIAAGVTGVVHVVCSFWVHLTTAYPSLAHRVVHYFYFTGDRKFGLANVIGAIAVVNLVFLTAISSDWALQGLGRRRWKQLQRTNYALVLLVLVHTALFWSILARTRRIEILTVVAVGVVLVLQVRGIAVYRSRRAAGQVEPEHLEQ